jgi:urea carboxylase
LRVDGWIETGTEVSTWYDPMLAKLIAHAPTRAAAIAKLRDALAATHIHGIETNLPFLAFILCNEAFLAGRQTTRLLGELRFTMPGIEVLQAGTMTTVQDWPGRLGYWDVGVPPSGPMDDRALRLANGIVGNAEGEAALEMTATGATLRFAGEALIALTGAAMPATLDGASVPFWEPLHVNAGSVLKLGAIQGPGQRSYLAVQGGFDLPEYMGSRATFTLGRFGGHGGRALRVADVLRLRTHARATTRTGASVYCMVRMAHRTSSRPPTSRLSSPPTGKCTTTPAAPACDSSDLRRSGHARTAARRACILRTSTTMPMPWVPSTSRATCR